LLEEQKEEYEKLLTSELLTLKLINIITLFQLDFYCVFDFFEAHCNYCYDLSSSWGFQATYEFI